MSVEGEPAPEPVVVGTDSMAGVATVALFSLSLSVVSVAVPILIVRAGYGLEQVGLFIALSALTQMAARIRIGGLMRLAPDKHLVLAAAVAMGAGSAILAWSTAIAAIVVSQLLQGAARGFFWTGVQTHAVRVASTPARGMASVNTAAGIGLILGPALAGLLLVSSASLAMATAAAVAAACTLPATRLLRLPLFPPPDHAEVRGRVTDRPGVRMGAWATASAGAWRGLLGAYVPVVLHQAAHSSVVIGSLVALANGGTILGGWASRRLAPHRFAVALALGAVGSGTGLAAAGLAAQSAMFAGAALSASGLAMGVLQTIGPAAAAQAVVPEEHGDAIAAVGLYRAAATFVAPFGVAGLLLVMPLGAALAAAGGLIALPAVALRGRSAGKD